MQAPTSEINFLLRYPGSQDNYVDLDPKLTDHKTFIGAKKKTK